MSAPECICSIDRDGEIAHCPLHAAAKELYEALERSCVALDDWLNIHASDDCDEARVAEARNRVGERGTISYIADLQAANSAALARAKGEK